MNFWKTDIMLKFDEREGKKQHNYHIRSCNKLAHWNLSEYFCGKTGGFWHDNTVEDKERKLGGL